MGWTCRCFLLITVFVAHCGLAKGHWVCSGTDSAQSAAFVPAGFEEVPEISVASTYNCARTHSGQVHCWGQDKYGETLVPSGLTDVTKVVAGGSFTCALHGQGYLTCWGDNSDGEISIPPHLTNFSAVGLGYAHTCAISSGVVACWGKDGGGRTDPPAEFTTKEVVMLTTDGHGNCATNSDGYSACWGKWTDGAPGIDHTLGSVQQFIRGVTYQCRRYDSGAVHCWGKSTPGVQVPSGLPPADHLVVGASATNCILAGGRVAACWGNWVSDATGAYSSLLANLSTLDNLQHLQLGQDHFCAYVRDTSTTVTHPAPGSTTWTSTGSSTSSFSTTVTEVATTEALTTTTTRTSAKSSTSSSSTTMTDMATTEAKATTTMWTSAEISTRSSSSTDEGTTLPGTTVTEMATTPVKTTLPGTTVTEVATTPVKTTTTWDSTKSSTSLQSTMGTSMPEFSTITESVMSKRGTAAANQGTMDTTSDWQLNAVVSLVTTASDSHVASSAPVSTASGTSEVLTSSRAPSSTTTGAVDETKATLPETTDTPVDHAGMISQLFGTFLGSAMTGTSSFPAGLISSSADGVSWASSPSRAWRTSTAFSSTLGEDSVLSRSSATTTNSAISDIGTLINTGTDTSQSPLAANLSDNGTAIPPVQRVTEISDLLVAHVAAALLSDKNCTEEASWQDDFPVGMASAQKICNASGHAGLNITTSRRGSLQGEAQVHFPASFMALLAGLVSGPVAFVQTIINDAPARDFGGDAIQGMVSVELLSQENGMVDVSGLKEPIRLIMPVKANVAEVLYCVYFDEEMRRWSREGITTDVSYEQVHCLTTHLSLFGVILQGFVETALCSQLSSLFTREAFMNLQMLEDWVGSSGSLAVCSVLVFLATVMVVARMVDQRHSWDSEFFLVERQEQARAPVMQGMNAAAVETSSSGSISSRSDRPRGEAQRSQSKIFAAGSAALTCGVGCCKWLLQTSAVRDAIDELMGNWFQHFSDIRQFCEEFCEEFCTAIGPMSRGTSGTELLHGLSVRATSNLYQSTLHRVVAACLGVSQDLVCFVLEDADLRQFLTEEHCRRLQDGNTGHLQSSMARVATLERRARSPFSPGDETPQTLTPNTQYEQSEQSGEVVEQIVSRRASNGVLNEGINWKRTPNKREAWVILHHEISLRMNTTGGMFMQDWGLTRMITKIFIVQNPLTSVLFFDPLMSSTMRALFIILDVTGTMMITAVFFQTSGSVKARAAASCRENGDMYYEFGRLIAIASASVLLSDIPVGLLQSLHVRKFHFLDSSSDSWERHLRAWDVQDWAVWVFGLLNITFNVFFVMLFIANVSEDDQQEFLTGLAIVLMEAFFVFPLAIAAAIPTLCWLSLHGNHAAGVFDRHTVMRQAHEEAHENTNIMLPIVYL